MARNTNTDNSESTDDGGRNGNHSDGASAGNGDFWLVGERNGGSGSSGSGSGRSESDERNGSDGSAGSDSDSGSGASTGNGSEGTGERGAGGSGSGSGYSHRSGNDSDSGNDGRSGGSAGRERSANRPPDYTGKRGRHPNECVCARCVAKRAGEIPPRVRKTSGVVDAGEPSNVPYDKLGETVERVSSKGIEKEALALAYDVTFELPRFLFPPGTADHWPLDDPERDALVEKTDRLLRMMPKRTHSKLMKTLEKIVPPIALAATAVAITKPRLDETRRLIAAQRRAAYTGNPNGSHSPEGKSSAIPTGRSNTDQTRDVGIVSDAISEATGRAKRTPLDAAGWPF